MRTMENATCERGGGAEAGALRGGRGGVSRPLVSSRVPNALAHASCNHLPTQDVPSRRLRRKEMLRHLMTTD